VRHDAAASRRQRALHSLAVNRSAARFHRAMHHLALGAMVLMLCMPLVSRWQQVQVQNIQGDLEMCLSETSRAALGMDGHAHHHRGGDNNAPPHDLHLGHDACGYCVLATRMLPVLALVLALSLPQQLRHSRQLRLPVPPSSAEWPAHSPRGPPVRL